MKETSFTINVLVSNENVSNVPCSKSPDVIDDARAQLIMFHNIIYYLHQSSIIVSSVPMYSGGGGVLWFSRRYTTASADISL